MALPQKDKDRLRIGGRYNFDAPSSDESWADWRLSGREGDETAQSHGTASSQPKSVAENHQHKHAPAPMQQRVNIHKHKPEPKRTGRRLPPTIYIGALFGLISFAVAFDFASDGKLRHLIQFNSVGSEVADRKDLPLPPPPQPEIQSQVPAQPAPIVQAPAQLLPEPPPPPPAPPPAPAPQVAKAEPIAPPAAEPPKAEVAQPIAPDVSKQAELVQAPAPVPETAPPPPPKPVEAAKPEAVAVAKPEPVAAPVIAPKVQGDVVRDCIDCPELIVVAAGSFMKVDEANAKAPAKISKIDRDFAVARNEITFDDWDKCVADGGCKPVVEDAGWGRGKRPQIFVSFDDVTTQYLPWLSRLTGKVYRLPTKDEWQYAALGGAGASPAKGNLDVQDCFNASGPAIGNCQDTFNGTAPVGSFAPNALGINDLKGNVWQWSADCWRPFTYSPDASPSACDMRIVLGGAWSSGRKEVSKQISGWEKSNRRTNSIGFRVVRTLP